MLARDLARDRETKPAAAGAARDQWLEQCVGKIGRYAAAVVADVDAQRQPQYALAESRRMLGARAQYDPARAGLDRVACEIEQRLLNAIGVGADRGKAWIVIAPHVGRVIGVDGSDEMLAAARARLRSTENVELRRGTLEALPIDLVLLDLRLPGLDGFEVCRRIRRRSEVPVVIVTARSDAAGIVTGLDLGADDYIVKPFEAAVLVARARAVLRRYGDDAPRVREVRDLSVDEAAFTACKGGERLALTPIEMRLLVELVRNEGTLMTREDLLESVWGYGYLGDSRLVDMAIKRLRDKLGDAPTELPYIATIRGAGYRFESDPPRDGAATAQPG